MIAVCPANPDHKRFITVAHEIHDWIVDEHGNFLEDKECLETTHDPDPGNMWTCAECGTTAVVTS